MKGLSSAQVKQLNKNHSTGIFFEAIIVTRTTSPLVKDYFAHFGRRFSFEGNVYEPCGMEFTGATVSSSMEIPTNTVNLFNPGGVVNSYIYDSQVRIKRNDIMMRILHMSRGNKVTMYDQELLQILVVRGGNGTGQASIFASLGWKLGDRVPKETIESSEYPGVRADIGRVGNA
jgi:hypothetical protein